MLKNFVLKILAFLHNLFTFYIKCDIITIIYFNMCNQGETL